MADNFTSIGKSRTLFKQGDKGGDLFIIKEGEVELMVRGEDGSEAIVATLGPNMVIGTMSFLEGDARSATAIAKTDLKYVAISQAQRDKLLTSIPTWLHILLKDLSGNLRKTNDKFVKLQVDTDLLKKKLAVKEKQKLEYDEKIDKLNQEVDALKKQSGKR